MPDQILEVSGGRPTEELVQGHTVPRLRPGARVRLETEGSPVPAAVVALVGSRLDLKVAPGLRRPGRVFFRGRRLHSPRRR